ncbi:MAG: ABC transporter permease subunit [Candidatus Cohnella colombiensis]|uniref:ABC transporter permease subunit n=1 Tax=Candidatus Cohnella colombiensis TaxID=3121368 RepID=A0AA95EXK4_9BACL|nr:MAG: ABC transporter permease subunit [Cohnella sp.]
MSTWMLLFRKEMLESTRNFKWLWIPLVFLLLGISNPISSYYMPQILEANGIDSETVALLAMPTAAEIMAKSLSQYGTIGIIVLALGFMGIIATERQSGSAIMVLVKPVSYTSYIMAKWSAMAVITVAALGLGQLGTWYYTGVLFETVSFQLIWTSFLVYALWLLFLNSITLLFSCLLKSIGGIAFITVGVAALLSLVTGLLSEWMKWSPSRLSSEAGNLLLEGQSSNDLWLVIVVTMIIIGGLVVASVAASKRMWKRE